MTKDPTRYVALLRGINVGKAHQLGMPRLKELLTERGHGNVRTHLRSGNVVLDSPLGEAELVADVEKAITKEFGFDVPVVVRTNARGSRLHRRDGVFVGGAIVVCVAAVALSMLTDAWAPVFVG